MIVIALWQAGNTGYATLAVLATVLTLGYFLVLQRKVFFGKLAQGLEDIREPGAGIVSVQIALAAITVAAGVFFPYIYTHFIMPLGDLAGR